MSKKAMLAGRRGFSQVILLGVITVLILAGTGGFLVFQEFQEKKMPSFEKTVRKVENAESMQPPKLKTHPELQPKSAPLTSNKSSLPKVVNIEQVTWAGHTFERSTLSTTQYKIDGNKDIKFTDSGFYAPSYSLPRSTLLDVNLNQKIKVKISGMFEGEMKNLNKDCTGYCMMTKRYPFSEFSIYMIDEDGNKQGMRNLGTRDNAIRGNTRSKYAFTELTVENTGNEIIVTDSSGFEITYSTDFKYVSAYGKREEYRGSWGDYGQLNKNQKWVLGINCHVNDEGFCKLDIREIQVIRL